MTIGGHIEALYVVRLLGFARMGHSHENVMELLYSLSSKSIDIQMSRKYIEHWVWGCWNIVPHLVFATDLITGQFLFNRAWIMSLTKCRMSAKGCR